MSVKAIEMYTKDNSGIKFRPEPDSNVAPHNRIDHLTHQGFHQFLAGKKLSCFYQRWSQSLDTRFQRLEIENKWLDSPSMVDFWMIPLVASMNEALTGPLLESLNPNFTQDFISYFPHVHSLMSGLAKWCIPQAYRKRDVLMANVRQWHAIARMRFRESDIFGDGDGDPWWGCEAIRERQKYLKTVDNWDDEAIAASDFGLLWG